MFRSASSSSSSFRPVDMLHHRSSTTVVVVLSSLLLLSISVGLSDGQASSNDCRGSAARFRSQNVSHDLVIPLEKIHEPNLEVCIPQSPGGQSVGGGGRSCCTRQLERRMHESAISDAGIALASTAGWRRMASLPAQGSSLRDETRYLFAVTSNATIAALEENYQLDCSVSCSRFFAELSDYFDQPSTSSLDNIRSQVSRLLDSLFASAFVKHFGVQSRRNWQQSHDCVAGFRQTLTPQVPLHDLESLLVESLEKPIRVTRAVLDAFDVSADVIRWAVGSNDQHSSPEGTVVERQRPAADLAVSLLTGHQCSRALTRLRRCALCDGHADLDLLRPCRPFCLNVARGCVAPLMGSPPPVVADVGGESSGQRQHQHLPSFANSWDLFSSAAGQLINAIQGSYDIDRMLMLVATRLTNDVSVMLQELDHINSTQISSSCNLHHHGNAANRAVDAAASSRTVKLTSPTNILKHRSERWPKVVEKFRRLGQNLASTYNFYSRLPEALCQSDRMSVTALDNCWNGANFGIYNKSVPPMSFSEQLKNPEVKVAETIPEAIVNATRQLSSMTKRLHESQPPRTASVIRPPRFQPAYGYDDQDEMSGEESPEYYPEDDEDGYLSGSGSGTDTGDGVDEPTSTRAATTTSGTVDIVFEPSTSKSPLLPSPPPSTTRHHGHHHHHTPTTARSHTVPQVGVTQQTPASGAAGNVPARSSSAAAIAAVVVALIIARRTGDDDTIRRDFRQPL